jgi:hypothetical protein
MMFQRASCEKRIADFLRETRLPRKRSCDGIQAELVERDAIHKGIFRFANEREQLQAAINVREAKIFDLESEVNALEAMLAIAACIGTSCCKDCRVRTNATRE